MPTLPEIKTNVFDLTCKLKAQQVVVNELPASAMPTIGATIEKGYKCLFDYVLCYFTKAEIDTLIKKGQESDDRKYSIYKNPFLSNYDKLQLSELLKLATSCNIPFLWSKAHDNKQYPSAIFPANYFELNAFYNQEKHEHSACAPSSDKVRKFYFMVLDFLEEAFPNIRTDDEPSPGKGHISNNLPRIEHPFIGRDEELKKIFNWLSPDNRAWLISITGIGGVGKSALALEVAHRCIEDSNLKQTMLFDYCVWTSAKQNKLIDGKIVETKCYTSRKEDIISEIIRVVLPEKSSLTPKKQEEQVDTLLREHRVLLVVDNMETIDDLQVLDFVKSMPGKSKAIITDRRAIKESFSIELLQMSLEESLLFIDNVLHTTKIGLKDDHKMAIVEKTGGIPLAIEWAIAQLKSGRDIETVLRNLSNVGSGSILQYLFKDSFANITENSKKVLASISLPEVPVSGKILMGWTEMGQNDMKDSLDQLHDFALILEGNHLHDSNDDCVTDRLDRYYTVLPLTRDYVLDQTKGTTDKIKAKILANLISSLREIEPSPDWPSINTINFIDKNMKLYKWAMELGFELSQYGAVLDMMRYLAYPMSIRGYSSLRLSLGNLCLESAQRTGNKVEAARNLISNIGWVLFTWYEYDQCYDSLKEGLRLATECHDLPLMGSATRTMGLIEKERKNFPRSRELLDQSLTMFNQCDDRYYQAITLGSLSSLNRDMGKIEMAEDFLVQEQVILDELPNAEELKGIFYQRMPAILIKQGNILDAEAANDLAREINRTLKRPIAVAYCKKNDAIISEAKGELSLALAFAREAETIFLQYGKKEDISQDIARILDKIKNTEKPTSTIPG